MDRCLVVANKTLLSDELLDAIRDRMGQRPCEFYLLVPLSHPWKQWSEGSIKAAARARLDEGVAHFKEHGIDTTGETGDANPVFAVTDLLLRDRFDEIIISTLPSGPSAWLHQDVPARLRRIVSVPVTHVVTAAPQRVRAL
jgi:GABA permease